LSLSKRRKKLEELESREQIHKHVLDLEDQHPKSRPYLSTRKHLKILAKENKQTKRALDSED